MAKSDLIIKFSRLLYFARVTVYEDCEQGLTGNTSFFFQGYEEKLSQ